jgi:hypothetical protein
MSAAITASGGAALVAIGTVAIFSAAGVLFVLGLRPLVVKALDYVTEPGSPSEPGS